MTYQAQEIISLAKDMEVKIITAESCTCGRLVDSLCVPGASSVLLGGYVTYTNAGKIRDLGVNPCTLQKHTEVSPQCAEEMAQGALIRARKTEGTNSYLLAVSTTGFVGPYEETSPTKDWHAYIGVVCSWAPGVFVQEVRFKADTRSANRDLVVNAALKWTYIALGVDGHFPNSP